MEVLAIICVAIMLAILYFGLWMSLEWDPEARITGVCTTVWVVVALFLFLTQWLTVKEHELYGLLAITVLSTTGYIFGRTLAALRRQSWIEE